MILINRKNTSTAVVLLFLLFSFMHDSYAQVYCEGDSIDLRALNYESGTPQWQYSYDAQEWSNISGANQLSFMYYPDTSVYLRLSIDDPLCGEVYYTDTQYVELIKMPCTADAGESQTDLEGTSTSLNANTPQVGTGTWAIYSGQSGSFSDVNDPQARFYGIPGESYNLRWTISNPCSSSSSGVIISFKEDQSQESFIADFYVKDESNQNIENASIYIHETSTNIVTNVNGHASIVLENGDYTYDVSAENYISLSNQIFNIDNDNKTINITLEEYIEPTFNVSFSITDENQQGISDAQINITSIDSLLITDINGFAQINLENGNYVFNLDAEGYDAQENISFTIDNEDKEIEITMIEEEEDEPEFSCGEPLIDPRDQQEYATVQIGNQCWMAENLNIGEMIDGSLNQTDTDIIEKYCYENDPDNCDTYGGLYQWDQLMNYSNQESTQGICPPGWHVPSDSEYIELEEYLGMQDANLINTFRGYGVGTELHHGGEAGFDMLFSGARNSSGGWQFIEGSSIEFGYTYTSTENGSNAYRRCFRNGNTGVGRFNNWSKNSGLSLRCVKN